MHEVKQTTNKIVFLVCCILVACLVTHAQNVGINNPTPYAKAAVDIASTTHGLLIPRMTTAQRTAAVFLQNGVVNAGSDGMMVYDTDMRVLMLWNGTTNRWDSLLTRLNSNGQYWRLTGNTSTDPAINYIGTTDSTDFVLRTNGRERFRIKANGLFYTSNQPGTSNILMGGAAGASMTGGYNSGYGLSALTNNLAGSYNSALGSFALASNTTGSQNTAVGYAALFSNQTGTENTAIGDSALYTNQGAPPLGSGNTAVGEKAGKKTHQVLVIPLWAGILCIITKQVIKMWLLVIVHLH